jgi:uncharacterized protein (TIGR00255 family)
MRSMTGYGYAEISNDDRSLSVEIRSVNNRYLDVYVTLPSFLNPIEAEIKRTVGERALRGKVDVQVRLREHRSEVTIHVDPNVVAAARSALAEIGRLGGISDPPSYRDILAFEGVIQSEHDHDPERYRADIFSVLTEALDRWNATRESEGRSTARDITGQLERLRKSLAVFVAAAPRVEQITLEAVRSRFREVLGDQVDEQRVLAEAAALMVRHATNEEEVRLQSHVDSFAEVMTEDGSVGKRLDFICQEMNREINTTGSKTVLPEVQAAVVEAKDAVEAIREQLRNLE